MVNEEERERLKNFLENERRIKKEREEEEKILWFGSLIKGFTIGLDKGIKYEQEQLKEYYLEKIKEIIEKDKSLLSEKVIADAIKNGLITKYPELKETLKNKQNG